MKKKIKLISLNIELDRHLDLVEKFLRKERPDVVCLQEVIESDFPKLVVELDMAGVFAAMGRYGVETEKGNRVLGVGLISKLPMKDIRSVYYHGEEVSARNVLVKKQEDAQNYCRVLVSGKVQKDEVEFVVGTTHFTWAPDGQANDFQREHIRKLLSVLSHISEIVFCGDFNAPRGGEIFDAIAKHYKDHIPKHYTTSIDMGLHRFGAKLKGKPLMVDGLFSTPHYEIRNVRLQDGVSDHCAIVAEISKL